MACRQVLGRRFGFDAARREGKRLAQHEQHERRQPGAESTDVNYGVVSGLTRRPLLGEAHDAAGGQLASGLRGPVNLSEDSVKGRPFFRDAE
jgi:hypothetical protein